VSREWKMGCTNGRFVNMIFNCRGDSRIAIDQKHHVCQ